MLDKLKSKLGLNANAGTAPDINGVNSEYSVADSTGRLSVFGGESYGFASDVLADYASQTFYSSNKATPDPTTVAKGLKGAMLNRSIFNQYALFNYRGFYGGFSDDVTLYYRDQSNNKINGGEYAHNLTASRVIQFYDDYYPKIAYKPADFIFGKYYNQIPINHMITLRRFPMAVEDNIFELNKQPATTKNKDGKDNPIPSSVDVSQFAGVTAVTYMSETAGNKMDDLLKYTFGMNWKMIESEMQSIQNQDGGYTQQPFYSKFGKLGESAFDSLKGVSAGQKFAAQNRPGQGEDRLLQTYANFVLGPVNVIDQTTIRQPGLSFANDMSLTFEYELRSLSYVNPKVAMIDIISNMLTMTTNNAQFFGGGQRYYGSSGYVASQFGDINKLRKGDFGGYIGSVIQSVDSGFKGLAGNGNGGFDFNSLKNIVTGVGKNFLGNVLGSFLGSEVGSVSGAEAVKALISAEPTGNWHVTIGNPLNPIVTAGNMYCDNVEMTLGKGLGYDDFPMEVKFVVDVKHGKPRDKGDIENMFNAGRGRIYASAEGEEDILNIKGKDVKVYGAIQNVGTQSKQDTQSDKNLGTRGNKAESAPASAFSPGGIKKSGGTLTGADVSSTVSNVVSMIIDS